ncbi:MAG: hypothetical protein IKH75_05710 [Ruminococcus sp.]|nr:hypothetical protein [Ruminococcus sp.]
MEIIKHGQKPDYKKQFTCPHCGCEFIADAGEYKREHTSSCGQREIPHILHISPRQMKEWAMTSPLQPEMQPLDSCSTTDRFLIFTPVSDIPDTDCAYREMICPGTCKRSDNNETHTHL